MNAEEPLRSGIIEILGASAVDPDDLVRELLQRNLLDGPPAAARDVLLRALQMDTAFTRVRDDALVYVPALLNATTWTTWISAADAERSCVRSEPDLAVMAWWLIGDEVPLVGEGGEVLGVLHTDDTMVDDLAIDVIVGPSGWLDGLRESWAAVTVANGTLRFSKCESPPEPTARQIAAVAAGFESAQIRSTVDPISTRPPPDPRYAGGEDILYAALLTDRRAFTEFAVPPVATLWSRAQLEERRGLIAQRGFDWEAMHAWQRANSFRVRYGVAEHLLDDLVVAAGACASTDFAPDEGLARRCAAVLDDGPAAAALWEDAFEHGVAPRDIGAFAEAIDNVAPSASTYGTAWLLSRVLEASGDAVAASDVLAQLADPGCQHAPLLFDAAGFAADRGDAAGAYRLLRQAGVPDALPDEDDDLDPADEAHLLMQEVLPWALNRPAPMARRNELCPCGSGRKYKSCHLGRESHPLHERSAWLYSKARRYLLSRFEDEILVLAEVVAGDEQHLTDEIADLPLLHDIVLHEGGTFAGFLTAREALLPDDEALLAVQWSLVDRGVFEVVWIGKNSMELRNIGTGDTVTVVNVTPSEALQVGGVLCGRPLPIGDVHRAFSGFLPVPLKFIGPMTDAVATGDPIEVAEVLASVFARPGLLDADGNEMEWPEFDPDQPVVEELSQDDPQIRAILAAHIANYEARWLGESIPALGGRTPRDAVTDPVGREEVIRLLASIPIPRDGDVAAMDPRRLRAALGL